MKDLATIVLPNARVVQFRQRDADFPRFKIYGFSQEPETLAAFKEKYPRIDLDDCDGMELGYWITELWKH
jgi:hypothetical protein